MDNNIVASPRFKEVIAEIRDLGFTPNAKLKRGRIAVQRRVDFNQGVDARILCKDKIFLKELSSICIKPLRIAFDHIGVRKQYETAIRFSHEFGLNELSNYMLYNFHDSPTDLYQRMMLNIELNEELGIRIFSFPMRYQPTDMKERTFVGEKWNRYYLRSMQIILQATHGIVSGAPEFFKRAFGGTATAFENLLIKPHKFIFNRDWFEKFEGRQELEDYLAEAETLSASDKNDLLGVLALYEPSKYDGLLNSISNERVARIFRFYKPLSHEQEREIWDLQKAMRASKALPTVPDDERVEDAGLEIEPLLTDAK